MNATIEQINRLGYAFVEFALPMLIQSGVLILILLSVDLLLRKKVRAVFRYWIWMLVLVKLLLPTSLSSPVSLGRWFGDKLAHVDTTPAPVPQPQVNITPMPAVETITRAPAVVPVEPTLRHFAPAAAEPISPPSSPPTSLSWRGAVLLAWLAVLTAMALLLLQRALFVRRLVAQAGQADRSMTDALAHCRQRMAVKRKVALRISAGATSPAVCGLFEPVILVPENLTPSLSSGELRVVLLHELAHIKRRDLWVNLAQTILQIFYFYNPLLWLANAMIRRVREQAVDEMVLVAMGDKARQYPETLVNVAKLAFKRPALSLRLIGVVESKSALTSRIKHILNRPIPKTARLGIFGFLVVIVIAAILLPMAKATPGSPELIVKGVVKDAQTGKPIAGARVFDDGYGPMPSWVEIRADERAEWGAITNSAGEYSFLTWPEHHSISAEASGHRAKRESLYDGHFTFNRNDEEIIDFALKAEEVVEPSEFKKKLPNGVTAELVGICKHHSEGNQWWRPDGHEIDKPDFKAYCLSWSQKADLKLEAVLLFRFSSPPGVKTPEVKPSKGIIGFTSVVAKDDTLITYVVSLPGETMPERIDVRLAGPVGDFKQADGPKYNKTTNQLYVLDDRSTVILHPLRIDTSIGRERLVADLTYKRDETEYRLRYRLKGDQTKIAGQTASIGGPREAVKVKTFEINAKEEDIVELILEYRANKWVEFKNVALRARYRVVDPNGNPVGGAQVAMCTKDKGVVIRGGKLGETRTYGRTTTIVETDTDGLFDSSDWPDEFHLIAAHEKGFAWITSEQFASSPDIRLQSWGRIEGGLYIGRKSGADERMSLLCGKQGVRYDYETHTDAGGKFEFDKVPPGWLEIGYLTRVGDSSWSQTGRTPVQIKPGVTHRVTMGGRGRPVVGKFVTPPGYDTPVYFGEGLRALVTARPDRPKPENYDRMSRRQQQEWYNQWSKTPEAETFYDTVWHDPGRRHYTFHINKDGSFRIDDVIAGKYKFTVWIEERITGAGRPEEIAGYYGTIEVGEMPGGRSDEPLDLGELELSMHAEPVRVGDVAPLFEAETLDGEDLKLIDYRGKFVLLSFWQPTFHPEREQLQELYDTYNPDGRLEIIGLGGNDTLEEVKKYVQENGIPWPQIYTGEDFSSGIAKDYGLPSMYWIFLVDPDGKIIAKDLRGEKLKSAVRKALGATSERKP